MKKATLLLAWWFLGIYHDGRAVFGPFYDRDQCEYIRTQYIVKRFATSCWDDSSRGVGNK